MVDLFSNTSESAQHRKEFRKLVSGAVSDGVMWGCLKFLLLLVLLSLAGMLVFFLFTLALRLA